MIPGARDYPGCIVMIRTIGAGIDAPKTAVLEKEQHVPESH